MQAKPGVHNYRLKKCAKRGTRSRHQIWSPEVGTRFGSQKLVPDLVPRSGYQSVRSVGNIIVTSQGGQKWVPNVAPRSGYQIWSPEVGTRFGPQKWVPDLVLEMPRNGAQVGVEYMCTLWVEQCTSVRHPRETSLKPKPHQTLPP